MYYNPLVKSYCDYIGDDSAYDKYDVVPREIEMSRKSIDRYNQPPQPMSDDDLSLYVSCFNCLSDEFSFLRGSVVNSFNYTISNLDSTKSPGYPWSLKYPTKFDFWMSEDVGYFDSYWDSLATTTPKEVLSSVTIKEELRPVEKIRDKNVRTIVAMDVNHIVALAMLTMDMNERMVNNHLNCSSALGLSLLKGGANKFFNYMTPWGSNMQNFYSIDAKKFDSRFNRIAWNCIKVFLFDMLHPDFRTNDNKNRINNLIDQIMLSPLVDGDGFCYEKETGNNSGQFLTTFANILKNFCDVLFIYLRSVPKKYQSYIMFKRYTRLALVGDDIFINVHDKIKHFITANKFHQIGKQIHMEYEFEDEKYSTFDKLSFIGHRFVLTQIPHVPFKMWLPKIDCEKMKTSMLRYNEHAGKLTSQPNMLSMCAGLRIETFACTECRHWFDGLFFFLQSKVDMLNPQNITAARGYLTDNQLWQLYSGMGNDTLIKVGVNLPEIALGDLHQ